jgi:hypothetical protein
MPVGSRFDSVETIEFFALRSKLHYMKRIAMKKQHIGISKVVLVSLLLVTFGPLLASCAHTADHTSKTSGPGAARPVQTPSDRTQAAQSTSNKVALCRFVSNLDSAVNTANTSNEALAAVKPFVAQFDTAVNESPPDIKPVVRNVVVALRQAVSAGTFDASTASAPTGASAYKLDAYCGIK